MTRVGREGEVTNGSFMGPKFQWPLFGNELEEFNFGSVPKPVRQLSPKRPPIQTR
jgi:hypothetical protein